MELSRRNARLQGDLDSLARTARDAEQVNDVLRTARDRLEASSREQLERYGAVARRLEWQVESLRDATETLCEFATTTRKLEWGRFVERGVLHPIWGYCKQSHRPSAAVALLRRDPRDDVYSMPYAVGVKTAEQEEFACTGNSLGTLLTGTWSRRVEQPPSILLIRGVPDAAGDEEMYFTALASLIAPAWRLLGADVSDHFSRAAGTAFLGRTGTKERK